MNQIRLLISYFILYIIKYFLFIEEFNANLCNCTIEVTNNNSDFTTLICNI